jgi:hypothetical protein
MSVYEHIVIVIISVAQASHVHMHAFDNLCGQVPVGQHMQLPTNV